jgi:hypothetical protein
VSTWKQLSVALLVFAAAISLGNSAVPDRQETRAKVTGIWSGTYHYPEGSGQESVNFKVVMIQDGDKVAGFMKETNTFGNQTEPWLQALLKGRFEEKDKKGTLTFTKTYDGTAGVSHDVEYTGTLSEDAAKVEGTWSIGDFSGRFTLEKQRIDEKTLESLK